jgi:hypothetical protein
LSERQLKARIIDLDRRQDLLCEGTADDGEFLGSFLFFFPSSQQSPRGEARRMGMALALPQWVIRVVPTGSKASPNVCYAFNSDRICASQRTDAMCQRRTSR